ncbi:1473_t:CDS:1 [Funneliformis geosporum]|uniref:1473_t:CDS:1 n=1 Tax=Funneliformis geosporum TaxID=1117311 RepID=A0A9W4X8M6_9GLOM|nr:1473_t:CDS:1 [Funneliformis geosporum]
MMCKNAAKQKNSDPKFIPYITPKAPKEAVISIPALSSFSTLTSVPTNLDLEIVQEVFGLLPEKIMEFEFFEVSKIATPNKISPVISSSNNNNNNYNKVDDIPENFSSIKNRSKLLDLDEYLEDDNMKEDLKDFTVITKAILFAVASHIKFTPKERNNSKIILTINNVFAQNDDF